MAVVIASGTSVSVAANTKSADQVTGQYQFTQRGVYTLAARASATGMLVTCAVGGINLVNDQAVPFFGATGAMSVNDHTVVSQKMAGGRNELFFRNSTGGALTIDYVFLYEPM